MEISMDVESLEQRCWSNLPAELFRDVLVRIEKSESSWPSRKDVVACAGVSRSWRENMKEIVKRHELSGQITFPISLKQPGPRDSPLRCFIKHNQTNQTYHLYLGLTPALTDNGKFLLAARKCRRTTCTDYLISLDVNDKSKGSGTYIGKLRSNFWSTKFTVYDAQPPHAGATSTKRHSTHMISSEQISSRVQAENHPVAHISYELNVLGSRGPRSMQCVMDSIPGSAGQQEGMVPTQGGLILRNKAPSWHEQLHCWCLNFLGRVTVASVKNFQLVGSEANGPPGQEPEKVILQFGKVGNDLFTMDFQSPMSPFLAFAICLSSFDTKIACG